MHGYIKCVLNHIGYLLFTPGIWSEVFTIYAGSLEQLEAWACF